MDIITEKDNIFLPRKDFLAHSMCISAVDRVSLPCYSFGIQCSPEGVDIFSNSCESTNSSEGTNIANQIKRAALIRSYS